MISKSLLYVDDDSALAALAARKLRHFGFSVTGATDPDEAFRALAGDHFDAVILDHYMDGVTGLDLLAKVEGMDVPPIIYVTGSDDSSIAVEALKSGAADYFIKSVGEEFWPLLVNVIEAAMESASLKRAKAEADRAIIAAKERAEILLDEVNHRVANSLALVASLIRLQITASSDPAVKEALGETQGRINAVAGMHRSLYTSDDVRFVDLDIYLGRLVSELTGSLGGGQGCALLTDLEPVQLKSDKAVAAGMIVTELVTNALKYAYPEGHSGDIRVCLQRRGERAVIIVEDDGLGMNQAGEPKGTGLGTRIARVMAASLGDGIQYHDRDRGTRVEVDINLD